MVLESIPDLCVGFVWPYKDVCLFDPIISWDKYELFKTLYTHFKTPIMVLKFTILEMPFL